MLRAGSERAVLRTFSQAHGLRAFDWDMHAGTRTAEVFRPRAKSFISILRGAEAAGLARDPRLGSYSQTVENNAVGATC